MPARTHNVLVQQTKELLEKYGTMTVRQVYYQFLPQGYNYRQIQGMLQRAREKCEISPDSIIDSSRQRLEQDVYRDLPAYLDAITPNFKLDWWMNETHRLEIWIEKETMSRLVADASWFDYQVPVCVCKGFNSTTKKGEWSKHAPDILYLGDFDPSGLSMDESNSDTEFNNCNSYTRIALTMEQIEKYNLPSVDVKRNNDPRKKKYVEKYGWKAWELDALPPNVFREIITTEIKARLPFNPTNKAVEENSVLVQLRDIVDQIKEEAQS